MNSQVMVGQLADAFHAGLAAPEPEEPALAAWIEVLGLYALSRLPRTELAIATMCKRLSDKARDAIRHNDQSGACRWLAKAKLLAESKSLSTEAHYVGVAEIAPAELYVEHFCGSWNSARALLLRALQVDQLVEDSYGYRWKIGHRIHLLTVAAAMSAEQGLIEDAARQTADILSLLAEDDVRIQVPGNWDLWRLRYLSAGMRTVLATQALRRFLPFLAGCARKSRRKALAVFNSSLAAPLKQGRRWQHFDGGSVRDHIRLLTNALGQPEIYLRDCLPLLRNGGFKSITFSIGFDAACLLAEDYNIRSTLVNEVWRLARGRIWLRPVQSHWLARLAQAASFVPRWGEAPKYNHVPATSAMAAVPAANVNPKS
jgi:hypothetical protein